MLSLYSINCCHLALTLLPVVFMCFTASLFDLQHALTRLMTCDFYVLTFNVKSCMRVVFQRKFVVGRCAIHRIDFLQRRHRTVLSLSNFYWIRYLVTKSVFRALFLFDYIFNPLASVMSQMFTFFQKILTGLCQWKESIRAFYGFLSGKDIRVSNS